VVELIHAVHIQKQVLATKASTTLSRLHSRKAGKGSPPPQQKNKNARLRDIAAREQHAMHKSLFTQPRLLFILETARAHRNQKPGPQFPFLGIQKQIKAAARSLAGQGGVMSTSVQCEGHHSASRRAAGAGA
jgi:hypothetical protein